MKRYYDLTSSDVLSRDQIRALLGKSKTWMYDRYKEGLPFRSIGGTRYTHRDDFNEFFQSGTGDDDEQV